MSKKVKYLLMAGFLLLAQTPALPIQRLPAHQLAHRYAGVVPKAKRATGKAWGKGIFKLARFVKKHAGRFMPHSSRRSGWGKGLLIILGVACLAAMIFSVGLSVLFLGDLCDGKIGCLNYPGWGVFFIVLALALAFLSVFLFIKAGKQD